MVEVEAHAKEAKVLIWEADHLGHKLLHHRLCGNGKNTSHTNITNKYLYIDVIMNLYSITPDVVRTH